MADIAYQVDGSVICAWTMEPTHTATFPGPANSPEQMESMTEFFKDEPPVVWPEDQ